MSDPFRPLSTLTARWCQPGGEGMEHLTLEQHGERITATSVVTYGHAGKSFGAWYQIFLDSRWHVKAVSVHRTDSRWFIAHCRYPGKWTDGDGGVLNKFDGCVGIEFPQTPFTHTPVIRQLELKPGKTCEHNVLRVPFDTLVPSRGRIRYTCLEYRKRYRVENLNTGKAVDIEVDDDGLVLSGSGSFDRAV